MKKLLAFFLLLLVVVQCQPKLVDTYPFKVQPAAADSPWAPRYRFVIMADVARLMDYYELFERYGYGGNGPCWTEHIRYLLAQQAPDLLAGKHLFFNEEGDTFYVHADTKTTVTRFMQVVRPVFGSPATLEQHLKQADPDQFIE